MLNWLAISIILINIVIVRPNTEFQNLGYLISNRKEIMQNYAGIKCILDLFGLLTLLIYALSYNHQLVFLKLFFYVDISTIFEIDDIIIDKIELKTFRYATYKLIRLLTFMLFILVWLSAIYFFIDYRFYVNETYNITENWLTWSMCAFQVNSEGQSVGTDIIQQYPGAWYIWLNYAIYWALQTISTVGYGDITPRNPVSVVFTNISILIMMFFFVFFLNSVIEIIDEMTSSEEKQKKSNIKKFKLYYKNAK
jgi:voltage-gated potassium channel Kch